jgi:hypothetical protein
VSFGAYPTVSLQMARDRRAVVKAQIAADTDRAQARRFEKSPRSLTASNTFEGSRANGSPTKLRAARKSTTTNVLHRLEKDILPQIGKFSITELKAPLLDALCPIEKRGALEMAGRYAQFSTRCFGTRSRRAAVKSTRSKPGRHAQALGLGFERF